MGAHAFDLRLRSCTNVMKETAAAVPDCGESNACDKIDTISNGTDQKTCVRILLESTQDEGHAYLHLAVLVQSAVVFVSILT